MKKIVIVGATTGIGKSLAELYAQKGIEIAITGRRMGLLEDIQKQYPNTKIHARMMDVTDTEAACQTMDELAQTMGGFDTVVINAGIGYMKATPLQEMMTIDTNVRGFLALARWSYDYFKTQPTGHIVGISSVAGVRSSPYAPEYHASKAFMSRYMEGLRLRSKKWFNHIAITDIRPGYVDTPMTKGQKGMFWVASSERAAQQIYDAIDNRRSIAYITKRYRLLAIFLKLIPEWIYAKVM
jgi:short-subunit dehydrogenase